MIGSPPGYVGHDEGGQLSDAIRTHPYSVVLFDEIEKAHPKVLDLFLQMFDDGVLTDAQGRKCDFSQSIILRTSNLGTGERKRRMGFGAAEDEDVGGTPILLEAVRRHFRPELVNRLTGIVPFAPLGIPQAREILGKLVDQLNARLADRRVAVELSDEVMELILNAGFSEAYGARNLERTMDKMLGNKLAGMLLAGGLAAGAVLRVAVDGGEIKVSLPTSRD